MHFDQQKCYTSVPGTPTHPSPSHWSSCLNTEIFMWKEWWGKLLSKVSISHFLFPKHYLEKANLLRRSDYPGTELALTDTWTCSLCVNIPRQEWSRTNLDTQRFVLKDFLVFKTNQGHPLWRFNKCIAKICMTFFFLSLKLKWKT